MTQESPLPLVLVVGGDPGGASALAPVIEVLRASGRVRIAARTYRDASTVWRKHGLAFEELDERAEILFPEDAQLVLTSTSLNGLNLEQQFILAARQRGIATLSVLDFWSNYRQRFTCGEEPLNCVPDRIAVMDAQARDEMYAEGFSLERLVVTGQPAFDDLASWCAGFTVEQRRAVRERFGVDANGLLVVFASQPFSAFRGADATLPRYLGFDERVVATQLLKALEKIAEERGLRITLVIRPHPREQSSSFDFLRSDCIPIHVTTAGDSRETIAAADLVTGMTTMLLVEACYLGCVVLSLQPNLSGSDILPTNRLGFSRGVYNEEEILPAVQELLLNEDARRRALENLAYFRLTGGAAGRVANLVYSLLQGTTIFAS